LDLRRVRARRSRVLAATCVEWFLYLGACDHWLGGLAGLVGDLALAAEHFEAALTFNAQLGARPALAASYYEYARALLRSQQRQAADKAGELLEQASQLAQALDLRMLQHAIAALRA
jgi:hypothetical protein